MTPANGSTSSEKQNSIVATTACIALIGGAIAYYATGRSPRIGGIAAFCFGNLAFGYRTATYSMGQEWQERVNRGLQHGRIDKELWQLTVNYWNS